MVAKLNYGPTSPQMQNPAGSGEAITPHDSNDLTNVSRAIYVGGAGNMVVVMEDSTVLTFMGVLVGMVYPIRARRVNATNTTATNLVALY